MMICKRNLQYIEGMDSYCKICLCRTFPGPVSSNVNIDVSLEHSTSNGIVSDILDRLKMEKRHGNDFRVICRLRPATRGNDAMGNSRKLFTRDNYLLIRYTEKCVDVCTSPYV